MLIVRKSFTMLNVNYMKKLYQFLSNIVQGSFIYIVIFLNIILCHPSNCFFGWNWYSVLEQSALYKKLRVCKFYIWFYKIDFSSSHTSLKLPILLVEDELDFQHAEDLVNDFWSTAVCCLHWFWTSFSLYISPSPGPARNVFSSYLLH